jgi:PAS domain S-box-containing protein
MGTQPDANAEEVKRLQRCINDLLGLLTLPAPWTGGDSSQVARTLLDALFGMLRSDFAYMRLRDMDDGFTREMARLDPSLEQMIEAGKIGADLAGSLGEDSAQWPASTRVRIGNTEFAIASAQLGIQSDFGVVVAGSRSLDFPRQTEQLLLSVTANQAVVALQEIRNKVEARYAALHKDERLRLPLRDQSGKIVSRCDVGCDVEDQKQAEEALAANERNLKLIIDTIPAVAWSARPDGSVEFFNQRYLDYVGRPLEHVQGWGWTTAVHPDDLSGLEEMWRSIVSSGQAGEAEARIRRFDGSYRRFLVRANPLFDEAGRVVKWYGVNTDIEDRKQADDELRRSEALLAEGQHISSTGTYAWSGDPTERMFLSEQFYRIFEYDQDTAITFARLRERFHPEDLPVLDEKIKQIVAHRENPEWEIRLRMPDGRVKYVRVIGRVIHHPDGRLERVGAVQDVTQRRLAEEARDKVRSELAHVTRITSLGALTASIAHEVNQPLSGIVTNASTCLRMLTADPPNLEGARETARRTIRDGNRAADVITRLRALFTRKTTPTQTMDLNEVTQEVITLLANDLQRNRVTLKTELYHDLPLVAGDRVQIQQVIMNLLRNASDAMSHVSDRPRQVLIKTYGEEEDRVGLFVKDAGVGFEPEAAERLFDAFYTTKNGGMGIGLSVSRSIIESHGGCLWAEPNDGPGATFSFFIPRQAARVENDSPDGVVYTASTEGRASTAREASQKSGR